MPANVADVAACWVSLSCFLHAGGQSTRVHSKGFQFYLVRVWDCKIGQIVTTCSHGFLFKCVEVQQILIHSQSTKLQQTFLFFSCFECGETES